MQTARILLFRGINSRCMKPLIVNGFGSQKFSTSSSMANDKIYELRTYHIKTKDTKEYMSLTKNWFHLRNAHSKQIGYWLSEMGGLNTVLHLWEYDSLAHRANVRAAMAKDETWLVKYSNKVGPMITQDNCLIKCLPGTDLKEPPASGVYEIQQFQYGSTRLQYVSTGLQAMERPNASIIGSFYTLIGQQSSGYQLWYHPDADNIIKSPIDTSSVPGVTFGHSRLIVPQAWSNMQ